jgi:tetratricopeptide (TPR) repeat protein
MNKWRISGLIVVVLLGAWLAMRSCTQQEQPAEAPPPPPREVFHASKPLLIEVLGQTDATGKQADLTWLAYELRYLLGRGQMRIAPLPARKAVDVFTLKVEITADQSSAAIALVAPDGVVERNQKIAVTSDTRLATLRSVLAPLPEFLDAVHASADWSTLIGTDDAKAYETFLGSMFELLGPAGRGFTQPPPPAQPARIIERLEALTKNQPRFARAWGVLAAGYLSVGGQDQPSLAQLAESSAERALSLDDDLAVAHAALGLVHMRRNEWIPSREQFDRALELDINDVAALEGASCLHVDAGQYESARPLVERAVALQPENIGALECRAYANARASEKSSKEVVADVAATESPPAARVDALVAILDGDVAAAQQLLRASLSQQDFDLWADTLLRAAGNRHRIPDALQAITRAASDGQIDASTEILCGTALRQAEFVFNRMSRLHREREHVPLRVLWLPQTAFLRERRRLEEIVSGAGLPAFWQEYGTPDICTSEPKVYGCKFHPAETKKK